MPLFQRFSPESRIRLVQVQTESGLHVVAHEDETLYHTELFKHCSGGFASVSMLEFQNIVESMLWAHGVTLIEMATVEGVEEI